jgi:hypothetical protein
MSTTLDPVDPRHRRDVYDGAGALLQKVATHLSGTEVGGTHVQVERRIPRLGGKSRQRSPPGAAGIVYQNVDPSELIDASLHQANHLMLVLDIRLDDQAATTR